MKKALTILFGIFIALAEPSQSFCSEPVFVENFEEAVSREDAKVLVIFGTKWCGHCKTLKKDIDSLNLEDYTVCMVDAEARKDLARKYGIKSFPTSLVIQGNKETARNKGYEKLEYQTWLDSNRTNKRN